MLIRLFNRIYQFILSNKVLKFFYYSILIVYPFFFIYKYQAWGLKTIGIHTNIIIPLYIITLSEFFISSKTGFLKKIGRQLKYITSIYLIIEFLLIIIRPDSIYNPNLLGQYRPLYDTKMSSYYHTRKPNEKYHLKQSEFDYTRSANSMGISDKKWSVTKDSNTVRILCLGDSFTEGDGAHADSSYVSFLRRSMTFRNINIEVMNAGRCGSDPFYDFQLLKDKLIQYKPDIVIQSFTTNDLYFDMLIKGGNERFQKDGTLKFRNNHWWEPVYAISYTSRILIQFIGGYDKYLIKRKEYPAINREMKEKSVELFNNYQTFAKENNIELFVFTLPFKSDLAGGTDNSDFHKKIKKYFAKFNLNFYTLQPCYEATFKQNNTSYKEYFWIKDGHHNAKGYEMMAKCIENILLSDTSTSLKFGEF